MKKIEKEQVKKFYEKNKRKVIIGGVTIGSAVGCYLLTKKFGVKSKFETASVINRYAKLEIPENVAGD